MACRESALPSKRGDLANYAGDTKPYTCEGEAYRQAQERSGRRGSGGGP
jgi:hypothetical protein